MCTNTLTCPGHQPTKLAILSGLENDSRVYIVLVQNSPATVKLLHQINMFSRYGWM